MLKKLADWTVSLTKRPSAVYWLGFLTFIESSVFPLPSDILYLPMVASQRQTAYRLAALTTVSSVLGGIFGWLIGRFAYETLALPVLQFYDSVDEFERLRDQTSLLFIILLLITSGLVHLPPIKIVTILAGVIGVDLWLFIGLAIISRGGRFFFFAWLIKNFGDVMLTYISARLKWIAGFIVLTSIIGYGAYRGFGLLLSN